MKTVTAADLIRILLELDQQVICPRPSAWGLAAELVATLVEHAEPSLRNTAALGDWRSVDLTGVRRPAPRELSQPTVEALTAEDVMGASVTIDYINHRSQRRPRLILPMAIRYGSTEFHPESQWLLEAIDLEKKESRTFALQYIYGWDAGRYRRTKEV